MTDTIDAAISNLRSERMVREIRDVVQVAGLIRLDRTTSFADMFRDMPLRDQIALVVTAVIVDAGPATVTVRLETPNGPGEPRTLARGDALVRLLHDLFDRLGTCNATMTMTLGISKPFWRAVIDDKDGRGIDIERQESLTTTIEEWRQVIVLRDGAENFGSQEYLTNTLERAIGIIERNARTMPDGYHRHWQMVDAEVLRLEVERRKAQSLD